jgi:hypothetical protein
MAFLRALSQQELLRRLAHALESAEDAFERDSPREREIALEEGLVVVGELYSSLDQTTSKEVYVHIGAACEECLSALGEASCGSPDALASAAGFVRSMRGAMTPERVRSRLAA